MKDSGLTSYKILISLRVILHTIHIYSINQPSLLTKLDFQGLLNYDLNGVEHLVKVVLITFAYVHRGSLRPKLTAVYHIWAP